MKWTRLFVVTSVAALALGCQPASNTTNNSAVSNANANANANASGPSAAAPTKDNLVALEKSAYEAWKTKDSKFWDTFLAANFVGYGASGKLDKAAAVKEYTGAECDVKSYTISDDQMTSLGNDAVLLTHKVSVDGTCGGQKLPPNSWAASVYVREGSQWKGVFHAETPVPDPNASPSPASAPADKPAASTAPAGETKADPTTDALFTLEKKAWDDWKNKNGAGLEAWAGSNLVSFTSKGRQDRGGAIKTWMEDGCQVKSVSLTDPSTIALGPDFSLLMFKASPEGMCGTTPLRPEYGTSIYGKEGGAWKAVFTMGTPMM
ncbi:MAG TPA: nuclear transport factor 2 family protein [Pyrinomonadaceae bacterium]